jgi:hypothetical protein
MKKQKLNVYNPEAFINDAVLKTLVEQQPPESKQLSPLRW